MLFDFLILHRKPFVGSECGKNVHPTFDSSSSSPSLNSIEAFFEKSKELTGVYIVAKRKFVGVEQRLCTTGKPDSLRR